MKKLISLLFVVALFTSNNFINAQCTLPAADPNFGGFKPPYQQQPCIERNESYNTVINIFNFGTVAGGSVTILWLRVDSIVNLPSGLSWSMNVPSGNQANT